MKKKVICLFSVIMLVLSFSISAFAANTTYASTIENSAFPSEVEGGLDVRDLVILERLSQMTMELVNQNGETVGTVSIPIYEMTSNQIDCLIQYVNQYGIQEFEREFKRAVSGVDNFIGSRVNVIEHSICNEVSSETQVNRANGNFSKTTVTYRSKTLVNANYPNLTFNCEWWAHVTVNFKKENNIITQVTGTGFNATDMTYPCSFENVRIPHYVGVNGSTCGATANYDVYRYFEVPLPMPIPIKFSINAADSVIAYSSDY